MEGHIIIRWKPRDEFEQRVLLMLFRHIRTPQSTPKRPFLRQEWLAAWFKTYQEWISRWQGYVRQGGLEKLKGEHEGWVLTPDMRRAILEIWVPNFWLSAKEVRERLLAAPVSAKRLKRAASPRYDACHARSWCSVPTVHNGGTTCS
jgi:hypothetical protein